MVRRTAAVVAFSWVCVLGTVRSAAAQEAMTVMVHVEDYAHLSELEWERTKAVVGDIFGQAGVSLRWAGPLRVPKQDWPQDGRYRVALVIANVGGSFAGDASDTADVLGRAAPQYSRAWVFVNRVRSVAQTSTIDSTLLLARAIAHEIGHLLLPDGAHAHRGIMSGSLALTQVGFFGFTPQQAALMLARIRNERRVALVKD